MLNFLVYKFGIVAKMGTGRIQSRSQKFGSKPDLERIRSLSLRSRIRFRSQFFWLRPSL